MRSNHKAKKENEPAKGCQSYFFPFLSLLLILLLPPLEASAQFQRNGAAMRTDEACFGFQPTGNFTGGSFWETQEIDLRDSFDMTFNLFLGGCGVDRMDEGLVFAFQPIGASLGSYRDNMGYRGLAPTLAVELDLLPDSDDGDPAADHLAILRNGNLDHSSPNNLAGPVPASTESEEVQDCEWHELRIVWRPGSQTIQAYFDCELRLSYTGTIIDELFGGDSEVLWGFTAGTRSPTSDLQICADRLLPLGMMEDVDLCAGSSVRLEAPVAGRSYQWTPREGLSHPSRASTEASPEQTTTYQVQIKDDCGRQRFDEVTVTVINLQREFDLGPPDTTSCRGETLSLDATTKDATYRWSTGVRDPRLAVNQPGNYSVTVSTPVCTATDEIRVRFSDGPGFSFGTDTLLCQDEELLLRITGNPTSVSWEDGSSDITRRISRAGVYRAQAANACGQSETSIEVGFQPCRDAYIPNAFSPNGDGINDRFTIFGDGRSRILSLRIFDRWGALVFEAFEVATGDPAWNGTVRGREAPAGTYLYVVEIEGPSGKRTMRSGELHLFK